MSQHQEKLRNMKKYGVYLTERQIEKTPYVIYGMAAAAVTVMIVMAVLTAKAIK